MSAARTVTESLYGVLIADDNKYVCASLRKSAVWAALRAEVLATAASGSEALSLSGEIRPHIVVTDIRMPGIDGLSLIQKLKGRLPECQVIVITGYDDFRLAQAALRAGATDIILKPIRDTEIERAARKAIELLEAEQRLRREVSSLKVRNEEMSARLEIVGAQARRALLGDLVFGRIAPTAAAGAHLRSLRLNLRRFQILVGIGFPDPPSAAPEAASEEAEALSGAEVTATTVGNIPLWLVDVRHLTDDRKRKERLTLLARELLRASRPSGSAASDRRSGPIIGASEIHSGAPQVPKAYLEAIRAAERGFFAPAEGLLSFDRVPESRFEEGAFHDALAGLQAALSEVSGAEGIVAAKAMLDRLTVQLASGAPLGLQHAHRRLEEIARICGIEPGVAGAGLQLWPSAPDLAYRSLEEAHARLESAILSRGAAAPGAGSPLESHHLEMVTHYLEANYAREVRLTDVAAALALSSSHLSRLIRRGTGSTFTELLTEVRIRAATRLLRETNAKVYQIADMVGMPNHAYFHQVFRKHTGKAPNEMR